VPDVECQRVQDGVQVAAPFGVKVGVDEPVGLVETAYLRRSPGRRCHAELLEQPEVVRADPLAAGDLVAGEVEKADRPGAHPPARRRVAAVVSAVGAGRHVAHRHVVVGNDQLLNPDAQVGKAS
jgi:hypothetical protein